MNTTEEMSLICHCKQQAMISAEVTQFLTPPRPRHDSSFLLIQFWVGAVGMCEFRLHKALLFMAGLKATEHKIKRGCSIYLFPHLCKSDMSKYGYLEALRGSLGLRDNEGRMFICFPHLLQPFKHLTRISLPYFFHNLNKSISPPVIILLKNLDQWQAV